VLPCEKEWYEEKQAEYGVRLDARYVGHPLVDTVVPGTAPADLRSELLLPAEAPLLALLPGSRRQEVSRLMPPMAEAVRHLRSDHPDLMPVVCMAPGIEQAVYEKAIRRAGLPIAPNIPAPAGYTADDGVHLVGGRTYDVVGAARAAAVASGTATLETGLLQIPMAIVYRLNPISWRITRSRVDVPHVGLVNLVAGRKVVPEILQGDVTGANLAAHLAPLLVEGAERSRVVEELSQVRTRLGEGGAAGRVADLAEGLLSDNRPEPLPEAT